jgi:hypothetical protein
MVAPTARRSGPVKGSPEQAPPRSRAYAPLEQAPPRSRAYAPLERALPRSRVRLRLARGLPRAHARPRTRLRAFNALTQQGGAIMRLGIMPRHCCANSLGGTHPRHCGGLRNMASVSSMTLRRLLPYG